MVDGAWANAIPALLTGRAQVAFVDGGDGAAVLFLCETREDAVVPGDGRRAEGW